MDENELRYHAKTLMYFDESIDECLDDNFLDILFDELGTLIETPKQIERVISNAYYYRLGNHKKFLRKVTDKNRNEENKLKKMAKELGKVVIYSPELKKLLGELEANPYKFCKVTDDIPTHAFTLGETTKQIYTILHESTRLTNKTDIRNNAIERFLKAIL